jgi:hypothetical protein
MAEQDEDGLIEEIETYLATGRGPRAAPEPRPRKAKRARRPRLRPWLHRTWSRAGVRVVVVVVVVAAGIVVVRHRAGVQADGPDHASTAPAGPGYSFMQTNASGSPVRWNPCAPLHYRTNLTEAPTNAAADLAEALAKVTEATGIRFVDNGATTVIPDHHYEQQEARSRYPVVIAWATPGETDILSQPFPLPLGAHELGIGGPAALIDPATGHGVYVSGTVMIDSAASAALAPGFGPQSLGVVLMHELGHLVGLGHTMDTTDVMNPVQQPTKDGTWGPGDLAGLTRLGIDSGCLRVPARTTTVVL